LARRSAAQPQHRIKRRELTRHEADQAEAERRHRDRLAAVQRYFGQQMARRGNPDADHALAFVETVADPEGLFAPSTVAPAIGEVRTINYNGIRRVVRVDANGRVASYPERQ
jgi:hypothetical protein